MQKPSLDLPAGLGNCLFETACAELATERRGIPQLAKRRAGLCRDAPVIHIPECAHWPRHKQRGQTGTLLLEFLSDGGA
jgi:hypothetical protein